MNERAIRLGNLPCCSAPPLHRSPRPTPFATVARPAARRWRWAGDAPFASAALLAQGIGHCSVIDAAGTSTELVQRFLNWDEQFKGLAAVKIIRGVLVMLGGVWLIYTAL